MVRIGVEYVIDVGLDGDIFCLCECIENCGGVIGIVMFECCWYVFRRFRDEISYYDYGVFLYMFVVLFI